MVYDGLHEPIISEAIWTKTREILSKNQDNKPSIPVSRITAAPLLKGIISCGICGSKMVPTYTIKKGRRYRYYLCHSKAVGNNDSCKIARLSASEAENIVTSQVLNLLKKPEIIVQTISESAGQLQESVVINSLMQVEKVWDELFPVEQARIISLLVKDVMVQPDGLNIKIFKEGLSSLTNELTA